MPFCKSCNAEIEFVKTIRGKYIPVNPKLIPYNEAQIGDNLVLKDGSVVTVHKDLNHVRSSLIEGYISHFATCPNSTQHRKS